MDYIEASTTSFSSFVEKIMNSNLKVFLYNMELKYRSLVKYKLLDLTMEQAIQIHNKMLSRKVYRQQMQNHSEECNSLNWLESELRLFMWLLIYYIGYIGKNTEDLDEEDWNFFKQFFPTKQSILFEFEGLNLIKEHETFKKWTTEQDNLLLEFVRESNYKCRWTQHAKNFYIKSGRKYFRSAKQCRQRWFNHLNPDKINKQWDPQQDYKIFMYVKNKGKKWAKIAKILYNSRSQHDVKNRYKSMLRRSRNINPQHLTQQQLVQIIIKRYQKICSNSRNIQLLFQSQQINTKQININYQSLMIPTKQPIKQQNIKKQSINSKQIFNIQPTKHKKFQRNIHNSIQLNDEDKKLNFQFLINEKQSMVLYQNRSQSSLISQTMNQQIQQAKIIRANIFISQQPFQLLRKHFKTK